jgi:hypothetical protein
MGKELVTDYSFGATAKTVTFDALNNPKHESILMITNVLANIIIYNFADPAKGGSVAGSILTLSHDTTSMSDTDPLEIWYWAEDSILSVKADSGDPNITYLGKAEASTSTSDNRWQIKRVTKSGKDVDIQLAGGTSNFDNIFDNREALSYS